MKNLITIFLLSSAFALPLDVFGQIDQVRMDKDIRVATKVLETLTQGDDNMMMYGDNVEGNYIEGYGVIFSVGGGYSIFTSGRAKMAYSYGRSSEGRTAVIVAPKSDTKDVLKDKEIDEERADLENVMVEFLADYSQMISQLKATDKIVVSSKGSDYSYAIGYNIQVASSSDEEDGLKKIGSQGISAELLKSDQTDFMSGKINHDQLVAKIKITKDTAEAGRSKDLDLFSSMLKTLYDDSYSETYFMSWKPEYERIKGMGTIYTFKVYSSYEEEGGYRMPGINKDGLTGSVRNENVEKLYPLFVDGMKENMIQYGRTISSMENDELLILRITLTKCDDCSIPKKIQLSVKQSVLANYNLGKLNQKDAIAQIKMKEL